jgi:hypothetical protein
MPLVYTSALEISQSCPWRQGRARRRLTTAGPGKQMTPTYDWDHHASIGGGGVAGSGFGEWRLRGRGGAPAAARVPASGGAMRGNG